MKIAFHTLGCKVNQYESEAMAQMFREAGHEIVGERDFADVYIVNTCTVTAVADKKSRQYIRRMKKVNPKALVAVTGCYAQIEPEEVAAIDGVDIITGTNEKSTLLDYVQRHAESGGMRQMHVRSYEELQDFVEMGTVSSTDSRTRAYIKVQEGCNRFCAYCVIPYARGPVRSRAIEDITAEAEALIAAGYKELVLTGINTAMFDMESHDLYAEPENAEPDEVFGIEKAIAAINALPGDFRIRLSSLEPSVVNADYVRRLFKYDKLCHHLHMSAQSGSRSVLKAMNRPYTPEQYEELAREVCGFDPVYGLSTDIIVGFPGEKESDFEDSCRLVAHCAFCRTHIFKYSKRPMTKAARMPSQVSPQVKNRRADDLQKTAEAAAKAFFEMNLALAQQGRKERMLTEEVTPDGRYVTGYTGNYIRTYIPYSADIEMNTFVTVRFIGFHADGMEAVIVKEDTK